MHVDAPASTGSSEVPLPRENVYGHVQRLHWFREHLSRDERAVEFGCGTGYMITLPMRTWGYDVIGVDVDERSVEYGRGVLERAGLGRDALEARDLAELEGDFDVVIASEVLEHLDDRTLRESLDVIHRKLRPGGRLLVTTPNGYGWFELEAFVWERLGARHLFERRRERRTLLGEAKHRATEGYVADALPSTLANSPHVRRFTLRSVKRTLAGAGFEVIDARGSVLVCGPISDLALTGFRRLMTLNARLGRLLSPVASGFYVAAVKR
jgi:SAM-dependent methyltransferase